MRTPCLAFQPIPVTQLPSTQNTWTLLLTQVFLHHYLRAWACPCRRDIKKNRVTLALSPKGVSQHLAFQIPAHFTSSSESTKNEISDSPSRKTAISQCDESSFFVFFFLFLCFFLFCFQWDFLSIIFLPKQKMPWTSVDQSWSKSISLVHLCSSNNEGAALLRIQISLLQFSVLFFFLL